ncbi:MAG: phosphoglucomutase/phosphomannomutase family protein [Anaerolineae bacterium]
MSDIIFGTDGWRGRIAEDYTFDNVRRCAQGFAEYLKLTYPAELARGVVIGGDKRFQSEHFAAAAAEVLAGNGIPVHFCGGGVPTPVISFGVTEAGALGAINITASHNPPWDNGFKVRDPNGGAIDPAGLKAIEARIPASAAAVSRMEFDEALKAGLIRHYDPVPAYDARIRSLVDVERIKDAGLTILVDNMWGNGAGYLSRFLAGGKTQVVEYHADRHPLFPEMKRPEPIPPNVDTGLAKAREIGADVVCILDGDADRCGLGDENGHFVDQLRVYGLLAMYFLEIRGERGAIIKTLSTTSMLDKLGARYGVPVIHTGVGFKYVAPAMMLHKGMIGGEESGGYAFRGHVPERDGILANLYLLDMMCRTGKKPTELLAMLFDLVGGPHYYDRVDTRLKDNAMKAAAKARLDAAMPETIAGLRVTDKVTLDGYQFIMEDGGWVLIRFSGTEPLIRVYCETMHQDKVQAILRDGMQLAGIA